MSPRPNLLTPFPAREGENLGGVARGEVNQKRWQTLSLRGWETGVQGAKPPWRGLGGCPPAKSKGGELPTLATCPRVGPNTLANPHWQTLSPRGWAKGGGGGASPLPGSLGDVPPSFQIRGRVALSCNPATSGTHSAGEPSAHGGGQRVVQGGEAPMAGGIGGVPPQNQKGGELPTLATCPRVGPKAPADP